MLGMHRDITERRRAAQSLADSHERFHALFQHSPVAISVSIHRSGEIIDVNPAFERLLDSTGQRSSARPVLSSGSGSTVPSSRR
jgi:PAS domain-containing protein